MSPIPNNNSIIFTRLKSEFTLLHFFLKFLCQCENKNLRFLLENSVVTSTFFSKKTKHRATIKQNRTTLQSKKKQRDCQARVTGRGTKHSVLISQNFGRVHLNVVVVRVLVCTYLGDQLRRAFVFLVACHCALHCFIVIWLMLYCTVG